METGLLSPKSDFIFKLIFGDEKNIDILADFLRAVLDIPEDEYGYLTLVDPHLHKTFPDDKLGILDVKIHTKTGKIIDIEIQVLHITQMRERIVYYTAKMITEQIGKGEDYGIIKKVISIVITDYVLVRENGNYHNRYELYDKGSGSRFSDIVEIDTLELPKLPERSDDTELWRWMRFLGSEEEAELEKLGEENEMIGKAVGVLRELSKDERTRLLAEEREKAWRDERGRLRYSFERGMEKGMEQGIKRGMEQGIERGMEQRTREIAKQMRESGFTDEQIESITGIKGEV